MFAGSALGFVFLRRFIHVRIMLLALAGLMAFVLVSIFVAYITGYGELLYDRFIGQSVGGGYEISSGRTAIWATALAKMFEAPVALVTGYGWNAYAAFRDFGYAPHNSYLGIYFELGVIGLILVLLSYANILRIARQALASAMSDRFSFLVAFIFGFLAALVAIFFVELHAPWLFIWAYAGISLRLAIADASAAAKEKLPGPSIHAEAASRS
jgi:O-antigen ligase